MKSDKYYSIPEVAKILGLSRQAIHKQVKAGKIKAIKIGRYYAIAKDFVKANISDIKGQPLNKKEKEIIKRSVEKTVKEYGDVLKRLGRE